MNFVPATYMETEGGEVEITALLNHPADRDVTVDFTTAPGTASEADYVTVSRSLTFVSGDTSSSVTVLINQDEVQEGTEQFTAALTNPTNSLELGSSVTAVIDIADDDSE